MNLFSKIFGLPTEAELNRRLLVIHQNGLDGDLSCTNVFLESALSKCNLMLSRKNLRSALTQDEEIDIGVKRARLEKIIEEIKSMYTPIPEDEENSGLEV
jgi:hypothetical protein